MAQPQPYNRRKRFFIEMSRTQLLISIAAVLFVLSWVFILGIIVGRGIVADTITSAMKTQIQKLQQEKKSLMDKYLGAEPGKTASSEQILKPQLDFYDNLSKKDQEPLVMKVPQPTLPPTTTAPPETKAPAEAPKALETKPPSPRPAETAGRAKVAGLPPPGKKDNRAAQGRGGANRRLRSSIRGLSGRGYGADRYPAFVRKRLSGPGNGQRPSRQRR